MKDLQAQIHKLLEATSPEDVMRAVHDSMVTMERMNRDSGCPDEAQGWQVRRLAVAQALAEFP